jgi:hypothetical protein
MREPLRTRLVAGLVLLVVFAAGVAAGFFLYHALVRRHPFPLFAISGPPPGQPPELKGRILEHLDRELDLTPEQHARLDTVLTLREMDLRAIMTEALPRVDSIATRTRAEIRTVLTPEQQEKFAEITERFMRRMLQRRERWERP